MYNSKNITKEELIILIQESKSMLEASQKLGIDRRSLLRLREKHNIVHVSANTIIKKPNPFINVNSSTESLSDIEKGKLELLKDKNNELEKELKKLQKDLALKDEEIQGIWNIKNSIDYKGVGNPDWLEYSKSNSKHLSIPTLMCSDEHWGEVVFDYQINYVNKYNSEIARQRYNNIINNYLEVTGEHLNNVDKQRMVLVLGGDNISGDIHEELSSNNDLTTMEAVYDYVEHKTKGIKALLNAGYKNIFIPCVSGNHDRNTKKLNHKNRNETSFAFIIYRFLQKIFADDKRVQFSIAGGQDCLYKVHNHKYLLTHGDCFKGGNGIGGISVPILRGYHKKLASYNATGNGFDSLIMGHFHQFTSINNGQVIINGTLKGYDEYSQAMGFGFQEPCQAFWLTHPERGITIQLPIYAENKSTNKVFNEEDWISWKK